MLLDAATISRRVEELAADLRDRLDAGRPVVSLVVMHGAAVFAADLIRALNLGVRVEQVIARSYRGTLGGAVEVAALPSDIAGAQILVVDDIVERGETLRAVVEALMPLRPVSVTAVALIRKPGQLTCDIGCPVVTGFDIGPAFVVGYGMDLDGEFRNLPDVCVIEP